MVAAHRGTMASVRRLFGWMAGLVGLAALARYLARRERAKPLPAPATPERDPAAELRRKLSESRPDPVASEQPLPGSGSPPVPQESLEERRARVHAKAEAAIAEMQDEP